MATKIWAALCCVVLGACGGGGGGGGGSGLTGFAMPSGTTAPAGGANADPGTNPAAGPGSQAEPVVQPGSGPVAGPGTTPGTDSSPITGPQSGTIVTRTYKLGKIEDSISPFDPRFRGLVLNQLNSPAFSGYYYTGSFYMATGNAIFGKSSSEDAYIWSMDTITPPSGHSAASFVTMALFMVITDGTLKSLFGKPAAETATYEYMKVDIDSNIASSLSRLNAAGAQGYCRLASGSFDTLMMRQKGASDVCTYESPAPRSASLQEWLDQLNGMGLKGSIPLILYGTTPYYVKVNGASTSYYYYAVDEPTGGDENKYLALLNAEGAKGATSYEYVANGGVSPKRIFRIATNCNRWWLC